MEQAGRAELIVIAIKQLTLFDETLVRVEIIWRSNSHEEKTEACIY